MTNRVLKTEEIDELLKQKVKRREFKNYKLKMPELEFVAGVYVDDNEQVLKLRLPGKWRIDQHFAGKTDEKNTVIVIDKAK